MTHEAEDHGPPRFALHPLVTISPLADAGRYRQINQSTKLLPSPRVTEHVCPAVYGGLPTYYDGFSSRTRSNVTIPCKRPAEGSRRLVLIREGLHEMFSDLHVPCPTPIGLGQTKRAALGTTMTTLLCNRRRHQRSPTRVPVVVFVLYRVVQRRIPFRAVDLALIGCRHA